MNPRIKHIIRQVTPPVVLDLAKRFYRARESGRLLSRDLPEWEAVEDSDAVWQAHAGWSHQSIADLQRHNWSQFLASLDGAKPFGVSHEGGGENVAAHNTIMTFGHVLGRVAAGGAAKLRILDWGGGVGHYYAYARRLHPGLALDYVIKDLAPLCEAGRDLLPEVTFLSDEDAALAGRYDLVFASSSLQYTRDYVPLLRRLAAAATGWLMVTRTPFIDRHPDFVVVQRPQRYGYMTEYPGWFINRGRFLETVAACGFALEREFLVGERPTVAKAPEQVQYRGFLFRRTDAGRNDTGPPA